MFMMTASLPEMQHPLTKFLAPFHAYNAWNSSLKEFVGSNVPHLALVASVGEFWDQAISQLGNNFLIFGGGFGLEKLADKVLKHTNSKAFQVGLTQNQQDVFHLGKGFVAYPMIASSVIASPFVRNVIMSHVTKKDNFVEIASNTPAGMKPLPESENHKTKRLAKEKADLLTAGKIMGVGTLLASVMLVTTHTAMANNKALPKLFKKEFKLPLMEDKTTFEKLFTLPQGDYRNVQDAALYFFWALPAYAGLLMASRDPVEFTENVAKTLWFGFAFMVAPKLVEKPLQDFLKEKQNPLLHKVFDSLDNMTYVGKLAVGSVLYAGMPTVMNRVFRHDRAEKAGLLPAEKPVTVSSPTPVVPVAKPLPSILIPSPRMLIRLGR
jgi:hypothetical protein